MIANNYRCCSPDEAATSCEGHDLPATLFMRAGGFVIPVRLVFAGQGVERVNLRREGDGSFTIVAEAALCWVCEQEPIDAGRTPFAEVA